jgi:BirA family biotin operon repressor/biotin-[acetyl-CoA-carboxylase] ligase
VGPRFYFETIDSTQRWAVEHARAGAPSGALVVAGRQTAGRGRADHRWLSPVGGLYLSLIAEDVPEAEGLVSPAVAAGLHDLFERQWGVVSMVRWPNDIVCPRAGGPAGKLAGILPERVAGPGSLRTVLGIGLNVAVPPTAFPEPLRQRVASLADFVRPAPPLDRVESEVVATVTELLVELGTVAGRRRWLARARELLFGRGRPARIDGAPVGRVLDLGDEGELWVEGIHGRSSHRTGTLTLEETA